MTRSEDGLRKAAAVLATAEEALAQEYLRLVVAGVPTWQAQKQAELELLRAIRVAQAEYEIAAARLRLDH